MVELITGVEMAVEELIEVTGRTAIEAVLTPSAQEYPSAAESLLEGLAEMFTISRPDLPSQLRRYLASANIIKSPNTGTREKTGW